MKRDFEPVSPHLIDNIRRNYRLSDVARNLTALKKHGHEWRGLCPFHGEKTPSFYVNDAKAFYHCFGCGAHGDIIDLVQEAHGLGFREAVEEFEDLHFRPVNPVQIAIERKEDSARDIRNAKYSALWWKLGKPIEGTPAEAYLASRAITRTPPDSLRFGEVPWYFDEERDQWGPKRPALLLPITLRGEFTGMQRIFITEDGRKTDMKGPKRTIGDVRGGSAVLGGHRSTVLLTGSPEDGLTLWQEHGGIETVHVCPGESLIHLVEFPPLVRSVTIVRQNDGPGELAAMRADEVYRAQGLVVQHLAPEPWFKDWNDRRQGKMMTETWKPSRFFRSQQKNKVDRSRVTL